MVANNNNGKRKGLDLTFETSNLTSSTAEIFIMIWIITVLIFLMMVLNLITGRVLKSLVARLRRKEAEVYEAYESTMESTMERAIMSWASSLKNTSRLTDGERKNLEYLSNLVGGKNVEMNEEFTSELFGAASTKIECLNYKKDQRKKDSFCTKIKNFFGNKQRKTSTTLGSKISGIDKSHEVLKNVFTSLTF